jgi:O-antigen ligase
MIAIAYGALWIFIFSVPWENVITIPGLGAISRLTGMVALAMTVLAALVSGRFRRWQAFHIAALMFVVWSGLAIVIFDVPSVPKKFWTYVQLFLVLWMTWELAQSRKRQLGLMLSYVLGAYVSAFGTIMVFRTHSSERRFALEGFDANDLASILALAIPMAWYLGMTYRQPLLRWLCRGYIPIGIFAIGLTGSRGGMVATMIALLIVPFTMTHLTPGKLVAALTILMVSGTLAVTFVPKTVVSRLATTSSDVEAGRLGGRLKIWVAGARAFSQRPLMGYGTSGFKSAVKPYLPTVPQVAHNSYLSVLVENGIIGFALFAWMLFSAFRAVLRMPPLDRRFSLVLYGTLLVVMLPLTWEATKPLWFVLASLVGLSRARALPERSLQRRPVPPLQPTPAANASFSGRFPQRLGPRRWSSDTDMTA